jgi:hypothetical protein
MVRDGKGQFASDLRERGFAVYEEGVRQTIELFQHEDIPVTAYFPGRIDQATAICERNARETRHCTPEYVSSNARRAGACRSIRVVAGSAREWHAGGARTRRPASRP